MKVYIANCYRSCRGHAEECAYSVVANTESEALGIVLEVDGIDFKAEDIDIKEVRMSVGAEFIMGYCS